MAENFVQQVIDAIKAAAVTDIPNVVESIVTGLSSLIFGGSGSTPIIAGGKHEYPFLITQSGNQVVIVMKENSHAQIQKPGWFKLEDWQAALVFLQALAKNHNVRATLSINSNNNLAVDTLDPIQFTIGNLPAGLKIGFSPDGQFLEASEAFAWGPFKLLHPSILLAWDAFTGTLDVRPFKSVGQQP